MSRYFWPILPPLLPVTLCHTSRDPPKVRHTSRTPPIFRRPSTKIPDKSPLYKFYLNCLRRFLSGGFVWVGFCPFPLLSQYICYNRKLNITLNFMFLMHDKNLYKRDVTCFPPLPSATNCHPFSAPSRSSVTSFRAQRTSAGTGRGFGQTRTPVHRGCGCRGPCGRPQAGTF